MSRLVVWSRQFVSNLRFQRSLLKTDSCDRALSRSGVSNLRYLQLIFETGIWGWVMSRLVVWSRQFVSNLRFQRSFLKTDSCDRALSRSGVSNLRFQRWYFQRYTGGWVPSRSDVLVIETPPLKSTVSTVTFRDRYLGMSYVSISGMIETPRLKSTVSTVTFEDRQLW